eukprot:11114927-Ditylum_brightwellii.AAC.1
MKELNELLVKTNSWDDAETVCSSQSVEEGDQRRGKASDSTKAQNLPIQNKSENKTKVPSKSVSSQENTCKEDCLVVKEHASKEDGE